MCGIAGIVNFSDEDVQISDINLMLDKIRHRGPDDHGVFAKGNTGLGHVRLSIIDLSSAGHQPMFSQDERYTLVFNGEIYNYIELRTEFKDKYQFTTQTDTEVLLASYILYGEDCLSKLNGDFSFVIYDAAEGKLFAARDRFGIKPFYYYKDEERLIFASEVKAIIPLLDHVRPNDKSIFEYLIYNRTEQSDETFFNGIYKLKHGHYFTLSKGKFKKRRWYNVSEHLSYPTVLSPQEYREEVKKAIALRLRSDVPLGVCLSGGIDSSTITSLLYNDFDVKNLKTFSAVFEKGSREDESSYIESYKGALNNMFFTSPSAQTFHDEFEHFITSLSEPVPSASPYVQYKVMQLAKGNVTVTLDGQGSDEMLGGYNYFFGSYFKELFTGMRLIKLFHEAKEHARKNPSRQSFLYFIYYMLPLWLKKQASKIKSGTVAKDFYYRHSCASTLPADLYNPKTFHQSLLQHFEYKLEHLLKWDDLNSMAFSIESRVPFLDHNLVEKTLSLPTESVLKNGVSKFILRESVKDILPAKIYKRYDKIGFSTSADKWFRTKSSQNYINEMLSSERFSGRGYLNAADCRKRYKLHVEQKTNLENEIWKWVNLEVWFQRFIDN